jgi:F-type H+-transporting ATPase subunit epsilon
MKPFHVELITPSAKVFTGEAVGVKVPGTLGSFEVLHNHAAVVSTLDQGPVVIKTAAGTTNTWQVSGGVVEVLNNRVSILAEKIQA